MKKHNTRAFQRICSIALAAVLVLSMPGASFAEAAGLEKKETVYLVLEPDGSVQSQSVSEHLHSETGLAGITDVSDLKEIQNTESSAGFTQSGSELTWQTDEADVYYQGTIDRDPPVSAEVTYALNDRTAPLSELLGKDGHLTITVTLTNHETGTTVIDGKTYPVCTPFATMVGVVLGDGYENITAEHGVTDTVGKTKVAGFVCLPGVRACIQDLLPEQAEDVTDYLLDEVVIEAEVTKLTAPSLIIACGTDTEALQDSEELSVLEKLDGLQEDMEKLDDAMVQLLDGAGQLSDGTVELDVGMEALLQGVGTLKDGTGQLESGAIALKDGAYSLSSGAASARDGAAALKTGADDLAAGLKTLQSGAGALTDGYAQLKSGAESLTNGLSTLNSNSAALTGGARQVAGGISSLSAAVGQTGTLVSGSQTFAEQLSGAAEQGSAAVGQLPTPEAYASLLAAAGVDPTAQAQLLQAYAGAYQTSTSLSAGLTQLNDGYAQINGGLQSLGQFSGGVSQLQSGADQLVSGLEAYTQGVSSAAGGAAQLNSGLAQLGEKLPSLTGGVSQLADGANKLSAGAGSLRDGNAALTSGAAELADGSSTLAEGIATLSGGVNTLADGADALKGGSTQLTDGAAELLDGLDQFNEEGISRLTGSVDINRLKTLQKIVDVMKTRLEEYRSFAGAPEEAAVSTQFIMKTAETMAAASTVEPEEAPVQEEEKTSLWQRFLDLFGKDSD